MPHRASKDKNKNPNPCPPEHEKRVKKRRVDTGSNIPENILQDVLKELKSLNNATRLMAEEQSAHLTAVVDSLGQGFHGVITSLRTVSGELKQVHNIMEDAVASVDNVCSELIDNFVDRVRSRLQK